MSDPSESVNRDALDTIRRMAANWRNSVDVAKRRDDHERASFFQQSADDCDTIVAEVEQLRAVTRPLPRFNGEDISDLPPSLQKELSITKTDDLENQLFTLVKAAGGEADIDTLLVNLWRRFKVEQNRRFLQNKLWRMTQKEMLWSVPGRKGVYTATEPVGAKNQKPSPAELPDAGDDDTTSYELDDDIPF